MGLYAVKESKLREVNEMKFKSEMEIHKLVSQNLEYLFGLKFIKNELSIKNMRFDTLAYDNQTKSFVIIEYKNTKSFSVIDQGFAYLSLLLNNKADFVLEFNDFNQKYISKNEIDWSASRVIFISPFFNTYQRESINFKDLPIELWEVKKYKGDMISLHQVNSNTGKERINQLSKTKNNNLDKITKELKVYTENDHLDGKPYDISELYLRLKEYLLGIDDRVVMKINKDYIGYRVGNRNFCDITVMKSGVKIWVSVPSGQLNDSLGIFRDCSNIGKWGNGDYDTTIKTDENIEYIVSVAKQAFNTLK